jgi:hypothetical protein
MRPLHFTPLDAFHALIDVGQHANALIVGDVLCVSEEPHHRRHGRATSGVGCQHERGVGMDRPAAALDVDQIQRIGVGNLCNDRRDSPCMRPETRDRSPDTDAEQVPALALPIVDVLPSLVRKCQPGSVLRWMNTSGVMLCTGIGCSPWM